VLLNADRLERMDGFFDRFGAPAIALARFILGVRVIAAFAAGVSRMHWATFLAFNIIGAIAWALVMGLIGFFAARGASALGAHSWVVGAVVAGGVILVSLGALVFHKLRAPVRRFLDESWIGRHLGRRLWVLATSLAAVLIFAKVAEDVATQDSGAFDGAIRDWAIGHPVPLLHGLFEGATYVGSVWVAVPLAAMAALLLWRRTHRVRQAAVLFAPLIGSAFFVALKLLFQREYPAAGPAGPGLVYSFPSGHATTVAALTTTIAYVLARERLVRWKLALPVAIALTLLAGFGRIYLDYNWTTDVIGGWLVGLFVAMLAAAIYEKLRAVPEAGRNPEPA
jgi:membrane-associated phospholipid phosphatase